ncbi:MarR family transcriptional regulator [Nocardioides sp. HB32]
MGHVAGSALSELAEELGTTSRALVAIAIDSVGAAPVEVTVAQHRLLVLLAAHGPQSIGAIAARMGVNPSNATRHCDRLERLGLLARRRSPEDARVVRVEISGAGTRLLDAVMARRREDIVQVLERMGLADAAALTAAFRAFNDAAQELSRDQWREPS